MNDAKWQVLNRESVMEHRAVRMMLERIRLPDGEVIADWPMVHGSDYVNILALDQDNNALILEGYKHGLGRSTWQVACGPLVEGEEPLVAAQRVLHQQFGYESRSWRYLSSFVVDADQYVGTGHFFLARGAVRRSTPLPEVTNQFSVRLVTPAVLQRALWDGRIGAANYAITIALGLLTLGGDFPGRAAGSADEHSKPQ